MSRRGENIRKRKDGRWEGRYIKGRKTDKSAIWGYVYGQTYAAVKKELTARKMESQIHILTPTNLTFAELSRKWESSISLGVKVSTIAHYHYTLQHYILPVLGNCHVKELTEATLEQGLAQIISPQNHCHKILAHSMARECLLLVRRICRYATHLHLLRPLEIQMKLPKHVEKPIVILSDSEQNRIKNFAITTPTSRKVGLLLMMQMGLRIGEVCGLQWGDFNLACGVLSITRTVKRVYVEKRKTKVVVQSPKTQSSTRQIPIPSGTLKILHQLHDGHSEGEWFLSGSSKKPVEPRCYYKSLRGYLSRANVPLVYPHALRHTFATTCLQAGCNVKTLSELMGHASSDVTMKRYVHTCWEWKCSEINRIFG